MKDVEIFPGLNARDQAMFALLCERALTTGNLLAPMSLQDVASAETVADLGGESSASLTRLLEQEYIYRSGWRRYTLTSSGFQRYAQAYIADYQRREDAIKDAVVEVEQTTTDAVMARTGESRTLVNHVLSLLQRDRQIGAFLTASGTYCITRIASTLRHGRERRRVVD
jgi:hypothetical protein